MGALEKALKDCEKALGLRSRLSSFSYYGVTYRILGMIATLERNWEKAKGFFEQSVRLLPPIRRSHLAKTYFEAALMYKQMGDKATALANLSKSLRDTRTIKLEGRREKSEREA